jgi:cbb3-type cytochrome oxidase subunit 3
MFKNYLKGIEGIADYPIVSLVAFFMFFVVMTIWLVRADKEQLNKMAHLPFHETDNDSKVNE